MAVVHKLYWGKPGREVFILKKKSGVFSLKYQVIGIVGAIVIFIAIIYGIFSAYETKKLSNNGLLKYEQAMESGYKTEIKSQVQAAISMAEGYNQQLRMVSLLQKKRHRMQQKKQ